MVDKKPQQIERTAKSIKLAMLIGGIIALTAGLSMWSDWPSYTSKQIFWLVFGGGLFSYARLKAWWQHG